MGELHQIISKISVGENMSLHKFIGITKSHEFPPKVKFFFIILRKTNFLQIYTPRQQILFHMQYYFLALIHFGLQLFLLDFSVVWLMLLILLLCGLYHILLLMKLV
jgi:hypothetical protein